MASEWLGGSGPGLMAMALIVGIGSGFGAVLFRWLIFGVTWLATGQEQFGQQGRVASPHLPWLGIWFLLLIPVLGGLLTGRSSSALHQKRAGTVCRRSRIVQRPAAPATDCVSESDGGGGAG
jgi:CIC family chloride channel protein